MKTLLRGGRRADPLLAIALFLAALVSAPAAHGAMFFVKTWGQLGTGNSQFNTPKGVAVGPAGQIYVVDMQNHRVQIFDSSGAFTGKFATAGSNAAGVAVNAGGQVAVTDTVLNQINLYDASGNPASSIAGGISIPYGVAYSPANNIYITDSGNNRITELFVSSFGSLGSATGKFNFPEGIAINASSQIYVADTLNSRVQKFDGSNNFLLAFGSAGPSNGQFNNPRSVALSGNGSVYVVDDNSRIQKFDSSGNFLSSAGVSGSGSSQFQLPFGVAIAPTGEIYVADTNNNRVQKLFDVDSWVSGTPHLSDAAVGPGQLLGSSLTLDTTRGLQIDGTLTIQPAGTLTHSGSVYAPYLVNNGQYAINGGTLTSGGYATNNASMSLSGGVVQGYIINNYGASLNAAGSVTSDIVNNGTLTLTGLLSSGGVITNGGLINIAAGQQLLNSHVTNSGIVNMAGGAIVGSGPFANAAGGTIRGDGAVTLTVTNSGGLIYANGTSGLVLSSFAGNVNGGEVRVADGDALTVRAAGGPWVNSSTVTLKGTNAALNGDTVSNSGTIYGQGRISSSISNGGTIRAEGGQLVLAGASVYNAGTIQSAAGTSVLVSQGLGSNNGLISLTGGAFDNNSLFMSNGFTGSILGNGTFSTGGLYNYNVVTFSDGNSSIYGAVTNSGGTITTYGTSATNISFYGAVVNSASSGGAGSTPAGRIKINGTTVRWLGGLTNNGIYLSDPADNYFTGLAVGASGVLQGGAGDRFFVTSPFTNAGQIDLDGTSQMVVDNGTGLFTQSAGTLHLGTGAALSAGTVAINGGRLAADGPGATITSSLVYASSTASNYAGILAGAGSRLTLNNPAAVLILSGSNNSYHGGTSVEAGALLIANVGALPDGTNLDVGNSGAFAPLVPSSAAAVPEPGTLALLAAGAALMTIKRMRR